MEIQIGFDLRLENAILSSYYSINPGIGESNGILNKNSKNFLKSVQVHFSEPNKKFFPV